MKLKICNKIIENPEITVVAKRIAVRRTFFTPYQIHKLLTFLFTGRNTILETIAV